MFDEGCVDVSCLQKKDYLTSDEGLTAGLTLSSDNTEKMKLCPSGSLLGLS